MPDPNPTVRGYCPACRGESLFLGSGGYVTCRRLDCPDPEAATRWLETRPEPLGLTVQYPTYWMPVCSEGQHVQHHGLTCDEVEQIAATGREHADALGRAIDKLIGATPTEQPPTA